MDWTNWIFLIHPCTSCTPALQSFLLLVPGLIPGYQFPCCPGETKSGHGSPDAITSSKERWGVASFNSYALVNTAQEAGVCLCHSDMLLTHLSFSSGMLGFAFTFVDSPEVFFQPDKVYLNNSPALYFMDCIHPSWLSSMTLLGVHAISSWRTLIEMLNLTNLWINVWGVPLIISHQLDFMSGIWW